MENMMTHAGVPSSYHSYSPQPQLCTQTSPGICVAPMSSPSQLEFVTVDVFTSKRYEGNPLAIVRIPNGVTLSQEQKQSIAREFNLSESTFLHENSPDAQTASWTVDIFLTTREIPFAGHPTIGTACYVLRRLAKERGIEDGVIEASFTLKAGPVGLRYDVSKKTAKAGIPHDVYVCPILSVVRHKLTTASHIHKTQWSRNELFKLQPRLEQAHGQGRINIADQFAVVSIVKGMTFVYVELETVEALELVTLAGESLSIADLDKDWAQTFVGMYFFVRAGTSPDGATTLRTRMIEGPMEDPATGSAASGLAAYLSIKEGRPSATLSYEITQGVEMGRRSDIFIDVEMDEDNSISQIFLQGGAVSVMEGRLTI
jgi:predicted PhzF superfamily epimerase YddE/YHI9